MDKIDQFKKVFPLVAFIELPSISHDGGSERITELRMNYTFHKESNNVSSYFLSFNLITPNDEKSRVSLKCKYNFQVLDNSLVTSLSPIFIDFITFLIADTIRFCKMDSNTYPNFNLILKEDDLTSAVRACVTTFTN